MPLNYRAAVPVFVLVLCVAAAVSHFTELSGAFLYVRTAFGDFVGRRRP